MLVKKTINRKALLKEYTFDFDTAEEAREKYIEAKRKVHKYCEI